MPSKVVSTRLDELSVSQLDLKAQELGITRNELVGNVLLDFLGLDKSIDKTDLRDTVNTLSDRVDILSDRLLNLEKLIVSTQNY